MKQRDLYWVRQIIVFLMITAFWGIISILNILQFNTSYMQEEREELQIFKRQIEWAVTPILKQNNNKLLQKYCDDFKDEDVEFRIFDENKNLLATSNPDNKSDLIIQGHNFNGITEWLSIDYSEYLTIKRSLLKKLHVKRITQILSVALLNGLNIDEL